MTRNSRPSNLADSPRRNQERTNARLTPLQIDIPNKRCVRVRVLRKRGQTPFPPESSHGGQASDGGRVGRNLEDALDSVYVRTYTRVGTAWCRNGHGTSRRRARIFESTASRSRRPSSRLEDPLALTVPDRKREEERLATVGQESEGRLIVVPGSRGAGWPDPLCAKGDAPRAA